MIKSWVVKLSFLILFASFALCGFSSCAYLKANPAPDSGFLPHAESLKPLPERSPFNAVWYKDREAFYELKKTFNKLYVAPVDTTFLEAKLRKEHLSKAAIEYKTEELRELARYTQRRLIENIKNYPDTTITVADGPGPKTLVLEMAIVELTPTLAAINALGTVSSFFIPGSSLIGALAKGAIAMEAIIRNGENEDILVEIKDREIDKNAAFTVRDFEKYGHARRTIDDWARVFAELATTPYEHTVTGLDPITADPF